MACRYERGRNRIVIYGERGKVLKEIEDKEGCRYKVNGICYNNSDRENLGKKCYFDDERSIEK